MEYLVTTPAGTYRVESIPGVEDVISVLGDLVERRAIGGSAPLLMLSRQQVLALLGRPTLPVGKGNPFPASNVIMRRGAVRAHHAVRRWRDEGGGSAGTSRKFAVLRRFGGDFV
jgi:hypothetical protein